MKIRVLNSTLSCVLKCIRFVATMITKKIISGIFILSFLGACTSPTAMIGPVYTLSSTGNIFQAGLNYGSHEMITKYTGKTPIENLQEISNIENNQMNNIKRNTLESEDFYILVKNKIEKTGSILKLPNQ